MAVGLTFLFVGSCDWIKEFVCNDEQFKNWLQVRKFSLGKESDAMVLEPKSERYMIKTRVGGALRVFDDRLGKYLRIMWLKTEKDIRSIDS